MKTSHAIAALAVVGTLCFANTRTSLADLDVQDINRKADKVLQANAEFRQELNGLPVAQRLILNRLSGQVVARTNQIKAAAQQDNENLAELRASQLQTVINQMQNIVNGLGNAGAGDDVQDAFEELEDEAKDLIREVD
jgi:hypothetical protein